MSKTALILVDLQIDFCPDGALAVAEGDQTIAVANQWMNHQEIDFIVATQDWHPKNHLSFAANHEGYSIGDVVTVEGLEQILWPVHCVQHTPGANFHPDLNIKPINKVIRKGTDPRYDSYSAFFDNGHINQTDLDGYLKENNIQTLYILGLATDYCVKYTVLDALSLQYKVFLVQEGCRGVNLNPDDVTDALDEMQEKGATLI